MYSAPYPHPGDGDAAGDSSTELLSAILNEIGAAEFFQKIADDYDDDSILTLSKFKPHRIVSKYGIPQNLASAFVRRCREATVQISRAGDIFSVSSFASSISSTHKPASLSTPVSDATLLRKLNLEIVSELGQGGFGRVYKCKNASDKLVVAVKLVNDIKNAKEAVREGQRLRRVKHKNIVCMHKVHDLSTVLGIGTCALEMEAVAGGNLSQHLEAARHRPEMSLPRDAVLRF